MTGRDDKPHLDSRDRKPQWNERAGKDNSAPPAGSADGELFGGRGNQRTRETGGAPLPEEAEPKR